MQKALNDLAALPEAELAQLVEREPLLVTQNGEPRFVAQSLDSFEAMVRRLRQLEAFSERTGQRGKLVLLRP
jgi:prevent-host-death family protein